MWNGYDRDHHLLRLHAADLLQKTAARRLEPSQPAPHLFLPPYHALSYDRFDPQILLSLATAYAERAAERTGAVASPPHPSTRDELAAWGISPRTASSSRASSSKASTKPQRLSVGYLSTDFGEHPTSHLMRSFWQLQREGRRVRATCFARSDDRSQQREHLVATCEEWVELTGLSWAAAAHEIRKRRIRTLSLLAHWHASDPARARHGAQARWP